MSFNTFISNLYNIPIFETPQPFAVTRKRTYDQVEQEQNFSNNSEGIDKAERLFFIKIIDRNGPLLKHFKKVYLQKKQQFKSCFMACPEKLFAKEVYRRLKTAFDAAVKEPLIYSDDLLELKRICAQVTPDLEINLEFGFVEDSIKFEDSTSTNARYTTQVTLRTIREMYQRAQNDLKAIGKCLPSEVQKYFEDVFLKCTGNTELTKIVVDVELFAQLIDNIYSSSPSIKSLKSKLVVLIRNFRSIISASTTDSNASGKTEERTSSSSITSPPVSKPQIHFFDGMIAAMEKQGALNSQADATHAPTDIKFEFLMSTASEAYQSTFG